MLSEFYKNDDQHIVDGLIGAPFVWSGEPNAILVNGHSLPVVNATLNNCAPEVIEVEPSKTYRFRVIGGAALADWAFAFEDHTTNISVVGADGRYTKPVPVEWMQVDSGQRFELLVQTKSQDELSSQYNGKTDFWIQLEDRYRPTVVTGYALLRYVNVTDCSTPACYEPGSSRGLLPDVPSSRPNITKLIPPASNNVSNTWLEYSLTPLEQSTQDAFPRAEEVTRRLYLSNVQTVLPDGQVPFMVNNHTWYDSRLTQPTPGCFVVQQLVLSTVTG